MLLDAFGIWSGLAFAVAAALVTRPATAAVFAAALVAALAWLPPAAELPTAACATAFAVAVALAWWRPHGVLAVAAAGGLAAGAWQRVLVAQGAPPLAALVLVVAIAIVTAMLAARRPRFAPQALVDEALFLVAAFALALAAAPGVAQGFRSAIALQAVPLERVPLAAWAIVAAAACLLAGGLFGLWRRR